MIDRPKAIVVGANGRIGSEVATALNESHDVVRVGRSSGDIRCDYTDEASVRSMFERVASFEALVVAAGGDSVFKRYAQLEDADFIYGFERKFLSQARLVRMGQNHVADGGSFTLSSGFLSHYPNPASVATGPLNAAVDAFVVATAPLLPRGIRLNVVSPAPVVEPERQRPGTVTAFDVARIYAEAVGGTTTGRVIRAWGGLPVPG